MKKHISLNGRLLFPLKEGQCALIQRGGDIIRTSSESSVLLSDYKDFYEDITALHDCNDCGIRCKCKFAPDPGQMVRINCPLWVEKKEK